MRLLLKEKQYWHCSPPPEVHNRKFRGRLIQGGANQPRLLHPHLSPHSFVTTVPRPNIYQSLLPPLPSLPPMRIPPPMGLTVEITDDLGVSLTVPSKVAPKNPKALQQWGCTALAEARRLPVQLHSEWAYLDGSAFSFNGDEVGSAAVVAHQDTTKAYASPCPYNTSKESDFRALIQFLRHLIRTWFRESIGICIDNR